MTLSIHNGVLMAKHSNTQREQAGSRVTQAVADRHADVQMDGQTLCDNKG